MNFFGGNSPSKALFLSLWSLYILSWVESLTEFETPSPKSQASFKYNSEVQRGVGVISRKMSFAKLCVSLARSRKIHLGYMVGKLVD